MTSAIVAEYQHWLESAKGQTSWITFIYRREENIWIWFEELVIVAHTFLAKALSSVEIWGCFVKLYFRVRTICSRMSFIVIEFKSDLPKNCWVLLILSNIPVLESWECELWFGPKQTTLQTLSGMSTLNKFLIHCLLSTWHFLSGTRELDLLLCNIIGWTFYKSFYSSLP